MAERSVTFYFVRISRVAAWLLLVVLLLYMVSGYALCGRYGADRLMDSQLALAIHDDLDVPFFVLLAVHGGVGAYLAMRRWGWTPAKKRP